MAYAWSRTRMGGWAVAQSPILGTTITLSRLGDLTGQPEIANLSSHNWIHDEIEVSAIYKINGKSIKNSIRK